MREKISITIIAILSIILVGCNTPPDPKKNDVSPCPSIPLETFNRCGCNPDVSNAIDIIHATDLSYKDKTILISCVESKGAGLTGHLKGQELIKFGIDIKACINRSSEFTVNDKALEIVEGVIENIKAKSVPDKYVDKWYNCRFKENVTGKRNFERELVEEYRSEILGMEGDWVRYTLQGSEKAKQRVRKDASNYGNVLIGVDSNKLTGSRNIEKYLFATAAFTMAADVAEDYNSFSDVYKAAIKSGEEAELAINFYRNNRVSELDLQVIKWIQEERVADWLNYWLTICYGIGYRNGENDAKSLGRQTYNRISKKFIDDFEVNQLQIVSKMIK
ncbi:MAG: hypothetical protein ABIL58_18255 [Pseudomonadota bacterium]